jgi:AraC-like DNA-binding protein
MEVRTPSIRTRTAHFVLRLNEHERGALERVAQRLGMNASETMRHLIRRADEAGDATPVRKQRKSRKLPGKAR